jgi:hypothetical protein
MWFVLQVDLKHVQERRRDKRSLSGWEFEGKGKCIITVHEGII